MEKINWISIVITIITSIIAIFNSKQKNGEKSQDEYFKDILLEYFRLKSINPNIDICEFVNRYKFKKTCIPNYIFYLADSDNDKVVKDCDNKTLLAQIMKVDYWKNYPNIKNYKLKIANTLANTYMFILRIGQFFGAVVAIYATSLYVVLCLQQVVQNSIDGKSIMIIRIFTNNIAIITCSGLLILAIILMSYFIKIEEEKIDIYTTNKDSIKSIIKNKARMYKQLIDKNYFPIKGTSEGEINPRV